MTSDERRTTLWGPFPEELDIIRPREVPSIAEWPEGELILPGIESDASGPFSYELAPWERGIVTALTDPYVREVTVAAPLQMGKTMIGMLWMCHGIRYEPAHKIIVMTDEVTVKRRMKRLRATFRANPFLLEALGGIDKFNVGEPTELGDMLLYLAWSNSDATMASDPIPYVIADEVALWSPFAGRSGIHALNHLRGRTLAFPNKGKILAISSPRNAGDDFDHQYEAGDRCEYWVPCANCRFWHVMRWWDRETPEAYAVLDRDEHGDWLPLEAYESGQHVRYCCPSCGQVWSDYARAAALQEGRWLPAGVTMGPGGSIEGERPPTPYRSFHVDGLMGHPRLRSLRSMAVAFVRAQLALKGGRIEPLRHFTNNHRGLPWKETRAETDIDRLKRHIDVYGSGRAPVGVQVITVSIDVQVDHLRYAVFGWGHLFECWPIEFGRLETGDTNEIANYELARRLVVKPWPLADAPDLVLPPAISVIDCAYHTETVLDFCRQNAAHGAVPAYGSARRMTKPYSRTAVDGALVRYEVNPLWFKDHLHRMLYVTEQPGGGYMHLPKDVTPEILGELCAEHKVMRDGWPIWVPKKEGLANHTWDLSYLATFAATIVGVGLLEPYKTPRPPTPKASTPPKTGDGFLDGLPSLK